MRIWDVETDTEMQRLPGRYRNKRGSLVSFSPDGRYLAAAASDRTVKIWEMGFHSLFLQGSRPTPLYRTFMEAVRFLWQLDAQDLEIGHKERTPADMERFGALLVPPPPGQSKFEQIFAWAKKQQGK